MNTNMRIFISCLYQSLIPLISTSLLWFHSIIEFKKYYHLEVHSTFQEYCEYIKKN